MGYDYHDGQRELHDRFDTRRLADKLGSVAGDTITGDLQTFVETADMFFLATADASGAPECSYKGGDPGFVRVPEPSQVVFPLYDGNGMFLSAGNITVNPRIGMLFVDFESGSRLRVNGTAALRDDHPLMPEFPGALTLVQVTVQAVFANCRRYVHHYRKVERSRFVPAADHEPPVPDWKLDPFFDGDLPAGDRALDETEPIEPAVPYYDRSPRR